MSQKYLKDGTILMKLNYKGKRYKKSFKDLNELHEFLLNL